MTVKQINQKQKEPALTEKVQYFYLLFAGARSGSYSNAAGRIRILDWGRARRFFSHSGIPPTRNGKCKTILNSLLRNHI